MNSLLIISIYLLNRSFFFFPEHKLILESANGSKKPLAFRTLKFWNQEDFQESHVGDVYMYVGDVKDFQFSLELANYRIKQ